MSIEDMKEALKNIRSKRVHSKVGATKCFNCKEECPVLIINNIAICEECIDDIKEIFSKIKEELKELD